MEFNDRRQPEQLPLFMSTDDLVSKVNKIDSHHSPIIVHRLESKGFYSEEWSPEDQWSRRHTIRDASPPYLNAGESLAEHKLKDVDTNNPDLFDAVRYDRTPPLRVHQGDVGGPMTLADGHHRLAVHEALGHQFVPVLFRKQPVWGASAVKFQ